MNEIQDDIKATASAIAQDAATIGAIEAEKSTLDAEDPKVDDLSLKAEVVATRLLHETRIERELAAEADQSDTQIPSR